MTIVEYAKQFIGRPYIWGGDGTTRTHGGFDCSGLVLECLWAFGIYTGKDTTSQGLFNWAGKNLKPADKPYVNTLLFFGKSKTSVTHIALGIGEGLMIEAGGGGSSCKTLETSTGMVRVRPVASRSDCLGAFFL